VREGMIEDMAYVPELTLEEIDDYVAQYRAFPVYARLAWG
jgi:hypothetical protein